MYSRTRCLHSSFIFNSESWLDYLHTSPSKEIPSTKGSNNIPITTMLHNPLKHYLCHLVLFSHLAKLPSNHRLASPSR